MGVEAKTTRRKASDRARITVQIRYDKPAESAAHASELRPR